MDTLLPGQSLSRGQRLVSAGGAASAEMQGDGNFVVYDLRGGKRAPLWASGTQGKGASAIMQGDGNLVVYDASHHPVWASGTNGKGAGVRATIQSDGNFVLYTSSHSAVWSSHTDGFHDQRFKGGGNVFSDVVKTAQGIYNSIPMPLKAVLAPQALVTEYAVAHPESIPLFGKQAAQAKAVFDGLQGGNLDVASVANIAVQAIGPDLHLPPDVANAVTAAAHMAAAASPLASQAMQIAQASGQALTPAQVPHVLALKLTPPPPAAPEVHAALAEQAAAGMPPPVVHVALPAPKPGAPLAPPAAALHVSQAPGSPGAPKGATFWHCEPLPGGHWQCQWK